MTTYIVDNFCIYENWLKCIVLGKMVHYLLEKLFCMIYSFCSYVSLADTFYRTANIIIEKKPQTRRLKYFCAIFMIPKYWARYRVFEMSNWVAEPEC